MSEVLRGFVLLLSVVLWLPALRPFLDGQLSADQAALRYGGALLLSWGGVSLIAAIVTAYTPEPEPEEAPEPRSDAVPPPAAPPAPDLPSAEPGAPADDLDANGLPRRRVDDLAR